LLAYSAILFSLHMVNSASTDEFNSIRRRPLYRRIPSSDETLFPILTPDYSNSIFYTPSPSVLEEKSLTTQKPTTSNPPLPIPLVLLKNSSSDVNDSDDEKNAEDETNRVHETHEMPDAKDLMNFYYSTFLKPEMELRKKAGEAEREEKKSDGETKTVETEGKF